MLRVYFRYQVVTRGRGFALALADATTNDPASAAPVMCGATGNTSLGYAGAPPTGQAGFAGNAAAISAVSGSGSLATITTVTAHGFVTGNNVTISGVLPSGYNGTYAITRLSSTQFRYTLASNPGPSPAGIKPPKLAVEFDTTSNAALLDPGSDHFAFVFGAAPATVSPPVTAATTTPITAASWAAAPNPQPAGNRERHADGDTVATRHSPFERHGDGDDPTASASGRTSMSTSPPPPTRVPHGRSPDATHLTYAQASNGTYTYGTNASRQRRWRAFPPAWSPPPRPMVSRSAIM
jgi:hypothetical protein